ncbi:pyridoxamine 5'-phosphate oxidase family protein [Dermatobacter hominis]|uniref:pyridoxamine 5'-phosphate oxidase family protein n=1 Tax=Dermatobacter hominis TaxID=2884263 RepID=UPI001D110A3D|nr:pyridoxamine 5'-phosphate oxidase family protein [Dermatobacter hominis]UDY36736.1 pyridoxamine 5'-phosphate oxidase family protein [Dermatobacter hominis]
MSTIDDDVRTRLEQEKVVWLTTTTKGGAPVPNPVWFLVEGDDIVIHSDPSSRRIGNIERQPEVSVHINSDRDGGDFYVLNGTAALRHEHHPSKVPGFLDKYHDDIVGPLGTTVEALDAQYDTEIRVSVRSVRGV